MRNTRNIVVPMASVIAILLLTLGCAQPLSGDGDETVGSDSDEPAVHEIGDTGPAGGLVFYIDEADEHEWTYLEIAPESTDGASNQWEGTVEWGDADMEIGGDALLTGIGDGQAATDVIVAHMEGAGATGKAAQLADALEHEHEGTTYSDWFLPSQDEATAIWDNIVDDGEGNNSEVGGFFETNYWTSSEIGTTTARDVYLQAFDDGAQMEAQNMESVRKFRAIRAF